MKDTTSQNNLTMVDWVIRIIFTVSVLAVIGILALFFKDGAKEEGIEPLIEDSMSRLEKREVRLVADLSVESSPVQPRIFDKENLSPQLQAVVQIQKVVRQAQNELQALGSGRPEFSPEEREAFITYLNAIEDPAERQQLIQEHRESIMAAQESDPHKTKRERLQKITRIQIVHRSAQQFGWVEELRHEAEVLERLLMDFVHSAFSAGDAEFQQAWSQIEQSHHDLRQQAHQLREFVATTN